VPLIGFGQKTYIPNKYDAGHSPYFSEGSYQYLISDDVNIRIGPSTKTSIVANLPIGSRLKIIEELSSRYTYNNISLPWYKVSFILDGTEKTGYVVGIFIAEAFYISDRNKELVFLTGMSKYYPGDQVPNYQVRVAYQNKEIDRIEFPPSDYGDLYFDVSNKDINNGIYIITTRFTVASCYTQNNETTFFFDRKNLYHIKSFSNMDNKKLGFENGRIQINKLIWVDNPEDELNGGDYGKKEMIEEYIWDGRRLKRFY